MHAGTFAFFGKLWKWSVYLDIGIPYAEFRQSHISHSAATTRTETLIYHVTPSNIRHHFTLIDFEEDNLAGSTSDCKQSIKMCPSICPELRAFFDCLASTTPGRISNGDRAWKDHRTSLRGLC